MLFLSKDVAPVPGPDTSSRSGRTPLPVPEIVPCTDLSSELGKLVDVLLRRLRMVFVTAWVTRVICLLLKLVLLVKVL